MPAPSERDSLGRLAKTKDPMDLNGEADYTLCLTEDNDVEGVLEAGIALGDRAADARGMRPSGEVEIFVVPVEDEVKHYFVGTLEQVTTRIKDLNDVKTTELRFNVNVVKEEKDDDRIQYVVRNVPANSLEHACRKVALSKGYRWLGEPTIHGVYHATEGVMLYRVFLSEEAKVRIRTEEWSADGEDRVFRAEAKEKK